MPSHRGHAPGRLLNHFRATIKAHSEGGIDVTTARGENTLSWWVAMLCFAIGATLAALLQAI